MTKFKTGDTVWVKGKVNNSGDIIIFGETFLKEDFPYIDICNDNDRKPKVALTKTQADFLESFTYKPKALYYISRVGWDYAFTDNDEHEIDFESSKYKELLGNLPDEDELKKLLLEALINGYTVEQPLLYTVEIPNPNEIGGNKHVLAKDKNGVVRITFISFINWKEIEEFQLTEEEIKKDFEWAFQFAKPVEEK
ncbi:DUF1642 domain-containing protein [Streptococcus thoraltensis]|uniref:DUF1642 domain-containing protein n=1 Tax=Streptococcus thoraltensis TaxID=55085 RepID=UPI001F5783D6|nr:DUF1642 domain-containing protein [Streptococcus thoraltensis]